MTNPHTICAACLLAAAGGPIAADTSDAARRGNATALQALHKSGDDPHQRGSNGSNAADV